MEHNRDLNVGDIVYLNMTYEKYKHLLGAYATVVSVHIAQHYTNPDRFDVIYYDTEDCQCKQINVARFDIIVPENCTFQKGDSVKYIGATDNPSGCMCSDATIIDFTTYGPSQMSNGMYDIKIKNNKPYHDYIKYNVAPSNLILVAKKNTPISKRPEKINKEMKSKYKVGDKVIVRKDLVLGQKYGGFPLYGNMGAYMGKTIEITQVLDTNRYQADNNFWDWTDEMIEGLTENIVKSTYKVGDKVLIRRDLVQYQRYGQLQCVGGMLHCCGYTMEIAQVDEVKNSSNSIIDYVYMLDNSPYKWCKEMFEERTDCSECPIIDTDFLI